MSTPRLRRHERPLTFLMAHDQTVQLRNRMGKLALSPVLSAPLTRLSEIAAVPVPAT
jgi:hypothetical protein